MSAAPPAAAGGFAWQPDEAFRAAANWQAFLRAERLPDYPALARRAAAEPEWFWDALIRFLGVRFVVPYSRVLDLSGGIEWPKWCVGGTTNATLSCLDRHVESARRDHPALVWESEDGQVRTWTYAQLHAETCRLAGALAQRGLRAGDAVGVYMPMMPETAAAFLALARLG